MSKAQIDNVVSSLCSYMQSCIKSDKHMTDGNSIAELTKALAELVTARALLDKG